MKYTILIPIHFFNVSSSLNRGIQIKDNMRLSNSNTFIEQLFTSTDIYEYVGAVGYHELKDSTYIYAEGEIENLYEQYGKQDNYQNYCFLYLRNVSAFLETLWEVEDHSSYVRDGFIYLHNSDNPKDGKLQKSSLSAIPSTSEGFHVTSTFSREHILEAVEIYKDITPFEFNMLIDGGRYPQANPLGKELTRIERSQVFVSIARNQTILPLKIFNYCNALECLFTTDNTEVTHKIAERAAAVLGTSLEQKIEYFKSIKKAYGIRSRLTHGQAVNVIEDELKKHSKFLDDIMRQLYRAKPIDFTLNNTQLEEYFLKILLD
ncbi:hypothetical protein ACFVAD_19090 [Sutcliffiella sp. NPDC057660]|uniref:hypothetical protein n=1 Tax=Sutcliffiella sp. NPDC057660 TaxID=3346199 RepID=UPI0036B3611C